jgi:hypothetical protein
MKFNITFKTLINELRNYLALGVYLVGYILALPSTICFTIYDFITVDDDGKSSA